MTDNNITEQAELELLRTVTFAIMSRVADSRGKNVTVRLDNLFAIVPELAANGYIKRVNDWYSGRQAAMLSEMRAAQAKERELKEAALSKLSDEERKALGV